MAVVCFIVLHLVVTSIAAITRNKSSHNTAISLEFLSNAGFTVFCLFVVVVVVVVAVVVVVICCC